SRQTVEQIAAPFSASVAVNASFFDNEGLAMVLAVDEGRPIAGGKRPSCAALVVNGANARILRRSDTPDPRAPRLTADGIPRPVRPGRRDAPGTPPVSPRRMGGAKRARRASRQEVASPASPS